MLLCLNSHSRDPAIGEKIRDCRIKLVLRLSLFSLLITLIVYINNIRNIRLKLGKN